MNYQVKDPKLIISQSPNKTGGKDFILKNGTKLGEVFHFLPSGIINKKETGIGATTLELKSKRNSIIIEPLRITVSEKEKLYLKTETKIFAFLIDKKDVFKKLSNYLLDDAIKHKKIILVIDNLSKLILHLGESFINYFFLFDEIDFMQSSSRYRGMMEYGIDLGKIHNNFALVSATLIDFSDPEMACLPVTSYNYKDPIKNIVKIDFFNSNEIKGSIKRVRQFKKLNKYIIESLKSSDDKILVALNSIQLISNLANYLVKNNYIKNNEVTLLISEKASHNKLRSSFSNLKLTDQKLPTRLNFITSAYFNGYDLEDEYKLLIYSSPPIGATMLSINEIKQIYGRNRNNGIKECVLFTHDITLKDIKHPDLMYQSQEDFLDQARTHVDIANCVEKHFKNKDKKPEKIMQVFIESFRDAISKNELNFSRRKILIERDNLISSLSNPLMTRHINDIAYFQIDYQKYILSVQKNSYLVTPAYLFDKTLIATSSTKGISASLEENGFIPQILLKDFEGIEFKIEGQKQKDLIVDMIEEVKQEIHKGTEENAVWTKNHKKICDIIKDGKKVFTLKSINQELDKLNSYNELNALFTFIAAHMDNKQHIFIREVKYHIKEGAIYSSEKITEIVQNIFRELNRKNLPTNFTNAKIIVNLVYSLKLISARDKTGKVKSHYRIVKNSPFKLIKLRLKKQLM